MTNNYIELLISLVGVCATVAIAYFVYHFTKVSVTQRALDSLRAGIKEIDPILTTKFSPLITPIPLATIKEEQEKDNNTNRYILDFLNEYEALALGVNHGLYDRRFAKLARRTALVDTYERFREFIDDWRNKGRRQDPPAWAQLEKLSHKWH